MRTRSWLLLVPLVLFGCRKANDTGTETDTVGDTDTDSDTDADTDSDTDADTDSDTDADTDSDTDADTDADPLPGPFQVTTSGGGTATGGGMTLQMSFGAPAGVASGPGHTLVLGPIVPVR